MRRPVNLWRLLIDSCIGCGLVWGGAAIVIHGLVFIGCSMVIAGAVLLITAPSCGRDR
jgi:hypothetical protein